MHALPVRLEHTRAGTEAFYKLLQVATERNPRATVLSVDAVGAFDHVSRQARLEGLRSRPQLAPLLPFARQFYGSESSYVWTDDAGAELEVLQAEGGEQGDTLMPALVGAWASLWAWVCWDRFHAAGLYIKLPRTIYKTDRTIYTSSGTARNRFGLFVTALRDTIADHRSNQSRNNSPTVFISRPEPLGTVPNYL